jgi:hypothetical protein
LYESNTWWYKVVARRRRREKIMTGVEEKVFTPQDIRI